MLVALTALFVALGGTLRRHQAPAAQQRFGEHHLGGHP
jgi:hypothetical protein